MPRCALEIFGDGRWVRAGEFYVADARGGFGAAGRFEYDLDYLATHETTPGVTDARAVSCRYPLSYETRDEPRWPAFLLDIIPSGAARRFWERELGAPNTATSDWDVLVRGAGNPPGNLRIAEAVAMSTAKHPGFTRAEVVARAERFLEYARERGAEIAGASGAGGDSPKLLLREDHSRRFHADGALSDADTRASWLVKFPRSKREIDRAVLEAEAGYYRVAKRFGVRTAGPVVWERDCLFIARFDRPHRAGKIDRLGFESLCSLAGAADFAVPIAKEVQAAALATYASHADTELHELFLRDVLDVALGNTDNHARNTAVLKMRDGTIALSPLYDFAPMCLDSEGIVRVSRWKEETGAFPHWVAIAHALGGALPRLTKTLAARVRKLPQWLEEEGVPARVRKEMLPRIERVATDLGART